ncbi:MAG: T9SS type A sorting domain-containing protein [Bacteroidales bacterium]|jgi:photosystem II stability/assembly factor-like uncharacterized protein|nr:T9SS type A sorting domain-containing protein [Bacteroidales bacterium]
MKRFLSVLTIVLIFGLQLSAQQRIYTPEMKAPANGAIDQMPNALLDWNAVTGQGTEVVYEVQLSQDETFNNPVSFPQTSVTAYEMSELNFNETYYWRVRASDGIATSDWSTPWSFTVVKTVTITSPANASVQNPDALLKWNEITGVTGYDIEVDTAYSWRTESSGQSNNLFGVFNVDETTAWAVGASGTILKLENNSWTSVTSPVDSDLHDVFFTSANSGWIVGVDSVLLHYDGNTWSEVEPGTSEDLNALFFVSETDGYAVGNSGTVLHYNGTDWSQIDVGIVDKDLFTVHGIDSDKIVITGASGNSAVFDGSNWTTYSSGNRDMLSVWMLASDNIWAGAKGGRLYNFNGTEWTEQVLGNRDWQGIQFLDAETGYLIGRNGNLAVFNGTMWELAASGTGDDLADIHLFDENSGYIVGNGGIVISYQGDGFNSEYLKSYTVSNSILEYRLSNLLFGKNHYFRMRTKHAAATSDWSSAASFTVISNPTLKTPANNATEIVLDPTLTWDSISGAGRYTIQIAPNQDFLDAYTYETNVASYNITGLAFGQDYYWRVNARHAGGVSDWSPAFKFNTISTVVLTAPANNATEVARVPRFTWEEIHGAQKYMVALDKAPDFPNGEIEVVEHNFWQHMFMLDPLATYYWRVKAIQGLDSTAWSETWSFTTANETSVEEQFQQAFKLYPNPANDYIQLKIESANFQQARLEIYNIIGSKVYEQEITFGIDKQLITIQLEDFKSGLYFVKLIHDSNAFTQRLIIE